MKRKIINIIYGAAVIGMIILGCEGFASHKSAFDVFLFNRGYWAAVIPMILLGVAVCNCNNIENSKHPKLYKFLIYIPAIICVGCILFSIGIVILLLSSLSKGL